MRTALYESSSAQKGGLGEASVYTDLVNLVGSSIVCDSGISLFVFHDPRKKIYCTCNETE